MPTKEIMSDLIQSPIINFLVNLPKKYSKNTFIFLIAVIYFLLLIPNITVSNAGDSGIIIEGQYVPFQSFPRDIQDLLLNQDGYYILILEDLSSGEQLAVISEDMPYNEGSFVRVSDSTHEWYSDSHVLFSMVSQPFNKIIIGKIGEAEMGGWIVDLIVQLDMSGIILPLSAIDFLIGGFLYIIILSYLIKGTVAVWNIPGILSCYSFQFFYLNIDAILNQVEIDEISMIFGVLFLVLLPFTIWLYRYEETEDGNQKIYELYISNKKIFSEIKNKFV